MIPIARESGSIVAFGGRALAAESAAQVPQLAGDAALLERQDPVRPALDEAGRTEARQDHPGRGLLRLRPGRAGRREGGRRHLRHGADGPAGEAAAALLLQGPAQLRSGLRRRGRSGPFRRAARGARLRGRSRAASAGRRSGHLHPRARRRRLRGTPADGAPVPRRRARSRGGRPRPVPRAGEARPARPLEAGGAGHPGRGRQGRIRGSGRAPGPVCPRARSGTSCARSASRAGRRCRPTSAPPRRRCCPRRRD